MTLKRINSGSGHRYKLDGRPVDGVTTLIGNGLPKPALIGWAARTVAEASFDMEAAALDALRRLGRDTYVNALKSAHTVKRNAAAVRGTDVHALAERIVKGERVEVPDELAGHVEAALSFVDKWRPAPVLVESVIASRTHKYAGTLDLVADLPDGRRALLDYKTSASGVWPETALQLNAYANAEIYLDGDGKEQSFETIGINCAYAVWLRADGYDVIPVELSDRVFDMFRCVAYVARRVDTMREWIGEAEQWEAAA